MLSSNNTSKFNSRYMPNPFERFDSEFGDDDLLRLIQDEQIYEVPLGQTPTASLQDDLESSFSQCLELSPKPFTKKSIAFYDTGKIVDDHAHDSS